MHKISNTITPDEVDKANAWKARVVSSEKIYKKKHGNDPHKWPYYDSSEIGGGYYHPNVVKRTHEVESWKNMNKEAVLRGFQKRANEHGFDASKYLPDALMKHVPPGPMPTPPMGSGAAGGGVLGAGAGALAGPMAATGLAALAAPGAILGGGMGAAYGAYKESGKPKEERNYVRRMLGNGAVGAGLGVGLPILAGAGLGASMGSGMADADTARYQKELAERAQRMEHPGVTDLLKRMLPR